MLPGLFRTLVGLVVAWFVFRFLDRLFGGLRRPSAQREARGRGCRFGCRRSRPRTTTSVNTSTSRKWTTGRNDRFRLWQAGVPA